jgi:hypothetical protein
MKKHTDIYFKTKKLQGNTGRCFICKKLVEEWYYEKSIFLRTIDYDEESFSDTDQPKSKSPVFNVCTNCATSAEHAEKIIIPLLKILYSGIVRVTHHDKKTNTHTNNIHILNLMYYILISLRNNTLSVH